MNKNKFFGIAILIVGIVLGVFSFITLPDDVVTQINTSGGANRMNKIPAILIPLLVTAFFSVKLILTQHGDDRDKKNLLGALLGIFIFLVMIGVNL